MYQDDEIYLVDVNNPVNCVQSDWVPGTMGFNKFGMGFVSNSMEDECDFLYAHSWSGNGGFSECNGCADMGKIDAADDFSIEVLGDIDYDGGELTGTGDGRLYAFAGDPAKLIEYDKSDASVNDSWNLNLSLTNAFAFAFWGGDFYFFTESGGWGSDSKVTHFDFDDSQDIVDFDVAPIRIVGAGVSTCAPTVQ
jgi:hypothetical protein